MSTTGNVKKQLMAMKLKDGLQDTIVYLRMLEGAKLAPVYERKRKHLMEQLLDLQGDTRREAPPKFAESESEDDDDDLEEPAAPSPVKRRVNSGETKVTDRFSKFEKPSTAVGARSFKYKTLEELKKSRNSVTIEDDKPTEESKTTTAADKKEDDPPEEEVNSVNTDSLEVPDKKKKKGKTTPKTTPSTTPTSTPDVTRKNRASSLAGNLFNKVKKNKKHEEKERSNSLVPTPTTDTVTEVTGGGESIELDEEDEVVPVGVTNTKAPSIPDKEPSIEEAEEGGEQPLVSSLERVTKRLGRYVYQKVEMTLGKDSVKYRKPNQSESKATEVSLMGAASAIRDSYQFELHTPDKSYTFRAETEGACTQWVTALGEAIEVCNPVPLIEEESDPEESSPSRSRAPDIPPPSVPQITLSSSQEGSPEKLPANSTANTIRMSTSYENFSPGPNKKGGKKEMPDPSTSQAKGYMYKKGSFGKWDRFWMVLTNDNTLYIGSSETSKKVQGCVPITLDTKVERKKGTEKFPHAVLLTTGKSKEMFATDSLQDYSFWIYCFETAASGITELLSEDEDGGELYEELGADMPTQLPPVPRPPNSPRPAPYNPPSQQIEEDIYEDGYDDDAGDIYEGLDEVELPPQAEVRTSQPPPISTLPPHRGPPADPTFQPPSLPPRNVPVVSAPAPSLPPRPSKQLDPQEYEAPRPSPPIGRREPPPIDEELYDDVIAPLEDEDTYDDVETVTRPPPKKPLPKVISSEELYEDMVPEGAGLELDEGEEYSDMTLGPGGQPIEEDEDLYDDVSAPPPPRPAPPKTTVVKTTPSSLVKPPPPKVTTPTTPTPPMITRHKSTESSTTPPASPSSSTTVKKGATLPNRPSSSGTKRLNTTGKVAQMSKMFGQPGASEGGASGGSSPPDKPKGYKKAAHSGSLMYKSPGKPSYNNNHCVLDNGILIFYNSPTDKLSHYRLSLKDATLTLGSPEGQGSKFTFQVLKGTPPSNTTHSFYANTREEFINWMAAVATLVMKACPEKEDLYHAPNDHQGVGGDISFQKDAVLWVILRDTPTTWTGVVGTSESSYTGTVGSFPRGVVEQLSSEDVYI